jgi:hypothetical protein
MKLEDTTTGKVLFKIPDEIVERDMKEVMMGMGVAEFVTLIYGIVGDYVEAKGHENFSAPEAVGMIFLQAYILQVLDILNREQ